PRREEQGRSKRKTKVTRAPGFADAFPRESDDSPNDENGAKNVAHRRLLSQKCHGDDDSKERPGIGQAGGDRRAEPFHASENKETRDTRDKNADGDEDAVDRKPKIDVSDKQKDIKPKDTVLMLRLASRPLK